MKKILFAAILISLFAGCSRNGAETSLPAGGTEVAVELKGAIKTQEVTRGDGMIVPDGSGYPTTQLTIGIITQEWPDNETNMPDVTEWGDNTTHLDRGFFGGDELGDGNAPQNGKIEYTDKLGTVIQKVLYRADKWYYYFVAMYPYQDADQNTLQKDSNGAAVVITTQGDEDIMATEVGYGNVDHPFNSALTFKHMLTCLKCRFIADTQDASVTYGTINSVKLVNQPDKIAVNIGRIANDEANPVYAADAAAMTSYPAAGFSGGLELPYPYGTGTPAEVGYMLAIPGSVYEFEIITQERGTANPIRITYDFTQALYPEDHPQSGTQIYQNGALPGTMYNLTFRMLDTAEILLEAQEVTGEYWLDQTFD